MYTSELDLKKDLIWNVAGTVFLALFGAVYEIFSHEVYSYYMIYAFAIPLVLGVLPYSLLLIFRKYPGRVALNLWNSGIAALSVGCAFRGALDIYGTTNVLSAVYPVAGFALLTAGMFALIIGSKQRANKNDKVILESFPD